MSVVMPVHNEVFFIDQAVESILNQTCKNFEFIIIDDGSTDDTWSILNQVSDSRVRLFRQENHGITATLNRGLKLAHGRYIARMDADDIAAPSRLADQFRYIEEHPEVVLVGSNCKVINARGQFVREAHFPESHSALMRHLEQGRSPFPHPSAMFNAKAARQVGGYNPSFLVAQDLDLWLRLSKMGKIACIQKNLLFLRKHDDSISSVNRRSQIINGIGAVICHHLRSREGIDPSQLDERNWHDFQKMIDKALVASGYHLITSARARLRRESMLAATAEEMCFSFLNLCKVLVLHPWLLIGLLSIPMRRLLIQYLIRKSHKRYSSVSQSL